MPLIYLVYILLFTYLIFAVIVYKAFGLLSRQSCRKNNPRDISVVIALKDEEKNIEQLVNSLNNIDYDKSNFEVIFVNDNSSDGTSTQLNHHIKNRNNFFIINAEEKQWQAKKGALNIGIKKATYDLIAITDADCIPSQKWLKKLSDKFSAGYDFVFGPAPLIYENKFIQKIAAFENLKNSYFNFASAELGVPISAAARNFAFKKDSFNRLGGFSNTLDTLGGDDDLLLREAVKHKLNIGVMLDESSFVHSKTPKYLSDYLSQKRRHIKTSIHYLTKQKLMITSWHLVNLLSFISIFFSFINPLLVLPFFAKSLFDAYSIMKHQTLLGYKFNLFEIIIFNLTYEVFVVVNFINAFSGKVQWK